MKVVIQRVSEASVKVAGETTGSIQHGLLILAGFEENESGEDCEWMAKKIVNLRIFNDKQNIMNLSCLEVQGELLLVSQFTLHASTQKGNRPGYSKAARPDAARAMYETFRDTLNAHSGGKPVQCGIFGADMKVSLINDGPVTIIIDSKKRE